MIIDWLKFIPALLLLLVPGGLFHGEKTRYRELSRDWDGHLGRVLAHGMHAVDLARAAIGMWLLLVSLRGVPHPHGLEKYLVLLTQGAIGMLAVVLQTAVCRHPDSANAPFAFVVGMVIAGVSPLVAVFALVLAVALAMGSHTPAAFFPVVALSQLGIGFWFDGKGVVIRLGFIAVAAMIPLLWAMLFHRELVLIYRAKRLKPEHEPAPLR